MKNIILIITILAIACSPVRKGYFKSDPDQSPDYKQVKKADKSNENSKSVASDNSEDEEYQPDSNKSNTFGDVFYPESEMSDTLANYYSNETDLFVPEKEVINETIIFNNNALASKLDIVKDYEDALSQFDLGNYSAAERKLRALSETLKEDDTLTYETKFYIAECYIAKNEFSQALDILKKLEQTTDTNSEITQKTLVRLGQIYCVLNMKDEAKKYFEKLKFKYPDSIYNKLGKCQ